MNDTKKIEKYQKFIGFAIDYARDARDEEVVRICSQAIDFFDKMKEKESANG